MSHTPMRPCIACRHNGPAHRCAVTPSRHHAVRQSGVEPNRTESCRRYARSAFACRPNASTEISGYTDVICLMLSPAAAAAR